MLIDYRPRLELKNGNNRLNISHYLFLLFWMLKPFYLWESGTMQVSDFVFISSFVAWIIINRGSIHIEISNLYFITFVISAFAINLYYMIVYNDSGFMTSSLYYLYNAFVVIEFSEFKKNNLFLHRLLLSSIINLIIQLLILVLNLGNYYYGTRFMGSFNDPNQFSFSMFTMFLVIYILIQYFSVQESRAWITTVIFTFLLSFYFVIQGSSTGMLLGFASFSLILIRSFMNLRQTRFFIFLRVLGLILVVSVFLFIFVLGLYGMDTEAAPTSSSFLLHRLTNKFELLGQGGIFAILKDRGIDKLVTYPLNMIYGSGEGGFYRFYATPFEIHSTLPGILYYYGLIPFMILCIWIWRHLKNANLLLVPAFFALLIESFTLANQRQPVFWIIIILGELSYTNMNYDFLFKFKRKI